MQLYYIVIETTGKTRIKKKKGKKNINNMLQFYEVRSHSVENIIMENV